MCLIPLSVSAAGRSDHSLMISFSVSTAANRFHTISAAGKREHSLMISFSVSAAANRFHSPVI